MRKGSFDPENQIGMTQVINKSPVILKCSDKGGKRLLVWSGAGRPPMMPSVSISIEIAVNDCRVAGRRHTDERCKIAEIIILKAS